MQSGLRLGVWGLGPGLWCLEFEAWGLRFGAWALGLGVWGLGPGLWGLRLGVWGCLRVLGLEFGVTWARMPMMHSDAEAEHPGAPGKDAYDAFRCWGRAPRCTWASLKYCARIFSSYQTFQSKRFVVCVWLRLCGWLFARSYSISFDAYSLDMGQRSHFVNRLIRLAWCVTMPLDFRPGTWELPGTVFPDSGSKIILQLLVALALQSDALLLRYSKKSPRKLFFRGEVHDSCGTTQRRVWCLIWRTQGHRSLLA